jgi:RHS repeat-associated protein
MSMSRFATGLLTVGALVLPGLLLSCDGVHFGGEPNVAVDREELFDNLFSLSPYEDTFVDQLSPNQAFGADTSLVTDPRSGSNAFTLFRAPGLTLPAPGSLVQIGTLSAQSAATCTGNLYEAVRIPSGWVWTTASTWNCLSDTNGLSTGCGTTGVAANWSSATQVVGTGRCEGTSVTIDLTADFQEWVSTPLTGGSPNGYLIRAVPGSTAVTTLRSFEYSVSTQRPQAAFYWSIAGTAFVPTLPATPPVLALGVVTNTYDSTRFIWDPTAPGVPVGSNIQLGVGANAIVPDRAAHLRGRVFRFDDTTPVQGDIVAAAGASVRVMGRPELGVAYVRADGVWDMVVNGGGSITLVVRQNNLLEAQRIVEVTWGDELAAPDIVLSREPSLCSTNVSGTTGGFLLGNQNCSSGTCVTQGTNGWATTDARGTRQVALYVPPTTGTELPGSPTTPVSGYRVCLSEYTQNVVASGPNPIDREAAMPADIAANTVYEFAMEGQIRQTSSAGAPGTLTNAQFTQDAFVYVRTDGWAGGDESLASMGPDIAIPIGSFDRSTGVWRPGDGGRVLDITCASGAMTAQDPSSFLGTTEGNALCASGLLLATGTSRVWRVPVRHFSPVDFNQLGSYPTPTPGSAGGGAGGADGGGGPDDSPRCAPGSIIHCEGRAVSETLPLRGTDTSLVYHSAHHEGRRDAYTLTIRPVAIPADVDMIAAVLTGGGTVNLTSAVFVDGLLVEEVTFNSSELLARAEKTVFWNGKDAFGRRVSGERTAQIRHTYIIIAPTRTARFGTSTTTPRMSRFGVSDLDVQAISGGRTRIRIVREERRRIGTVDDAQRGLGGWSVADNHTYDPGSNAIYMGSGERRDVRSTGLVMRRIGVVGFDLIPALGGMHVRGITTAPDGTVYFTVAKDGPDHQLVSNETFTIDTGEGVYRLTRSGVLERVAENLTDPQGIAIDRMGRVLVAGGEQRCVRRYDPSAVVPWAGVDVLGTCATSTPAYTSDGLPLSTTFPSYNIGVLQNTSLFRPLPLTSLAVLSDGAVMVLSPHNLTGNPRRGRLFRWREGDGIDEVGLPNAALQGYEIAAAPGNALLAYAGDFPRRLWRLGSDGSWSVVAGVQGAVSTETSNGLPQDQYSFSYPEDIRASNALSPHTGLTTDSAGRVYLLRPWDVIAKTSRVLGIEDGRVVTAAGPSGVAHTVGDACASTPVVRGTQDLAFPGVHAVHATADHRLLLSSPCAGAGLAIFAIEPPLDGGIGVGHTVVSEDRSELYEFDNVGRHVRTRDVLSNHTLRAFTYDALGRLRTMRDREDAVTTIDYLTSPSRITVTAPGGLVTTIRQDAYGYATSLQAPGAAAGLPSAGATDTWVMTYRPTAAERGLLETFREPGDLVAHTFTYETGTGRLMTDSDSPDSAGVAPTQTVTESFVTTPSTLLGPAQDGVRRVQLSTAGARVTQFLMRRRGGELWTRTNLPGGAYTESLDRTANGGPNDTRLADGSYTAQFSAGDPTYDSDAPYTSRMLSCAPGVMGGNTSCNADAVGSANRLEVRQNRSTGMGGGLITTTSLGPVGADSTWTTTQDPVARTITRTGPNGRTRTLTYDIQGRVTRLEVPSYHPVCIFYTGHRVSAIRQGAYVNCTDANPVDRREVNFTYTATRLREDVTAGFGTTTLFQNATVDNNRGTLTSLMGPGRTSAASFTYDPYGRLKTLTRAGHTEIYEYGYTGRGLFNSESTPTTPMHARSPFETTSTTYNPDGLVTEQRYRTTGVASVQVTRQPGTGFVTNVTTAYGDNYNVSPIDLLGRPNTITRTTAGLASYFTYLRDQTDEAAVIRNTSTVSIPASGAAGSVDTVYRTAHTRTQGLLRFEDAQAVNVAGSMSRLTYTPNLNAPLNAEMLRVEGQRGTVTSPMSPWSLHLYDGSLRTISTEVRNGATVLSSTAHVANAWGEYERETTIAGGTTYYTNEVCARDALGRVVRRREAVRVPCPPGSSAWCSTGTLEYRRYVYAYTNDRLVGVTMANHNQTAISCTTTTGGSVTTSLYGYDVNTGNRSFGTTTTYNADDQLTARPGFGYTYDNRGRLQARTQTGATNTYTFDTEGHMRSASSTVSGSTSSRTYDYDPAGRLVAIRGGGASTDEVFVYRNQTEPIFWRRGSVQQMYVYGALSHVPELIYENNDADVDFDRVLRVMTDERGSVRMVVDVTGTPVIVQRIEYDPWGLPTFVGSETVQPFGFAGAIWLNHARFWHMGARDYDPAIGRWTSKDPLRFGGGSNLYVYAGNDPVNFVDVTGEYAEVTNVNGKYVVTFPVLWSNRGGFADTAEYEAFRHDLTVDVKNSMHFAGPGFAVVMNLRAATNSEQVSGEYNRAQLHGPDAVAPVAGACMPGRTRRTPMAFYMSEYTPALGPHEFGHVAGLPDDHDNPLNVMFYRVLQAGDPPGAQTFNSSQFDSMLGHFGVVR